MKSMPVNISIFKQEIVIMPQKARHYTDNMDRGGWGGGGCRGKEVDIGDFGKQIGSCIYSN